MEGGEEGERKKKHRTEIDPAQAQPSGHALGNIRGKKKTATLELRTICTEKTAMFAPPPTPPLLHLLPLVRTAQNLQQRLERRKEAPPGRCASVRARKGPIRRTVVVVMVVVEAAAPGQKSGERTEQDDDVVAADRRGRRSRVHKQQPASLPVQNQSQHARVLRPPVFSVLYLRTLVSSSLLLPSSAGLPIMLASRPVPAWVDCVSTASPASSFHLLS